MNYPRVVSLDTTENIEGRTVGAKAVGIIRMRQIGLSVPSGFCVLAAAYREHLEKNNLVSDVKATVGEINIVSRGDRTSLLSDLRQAIVEAPLSKQLQKEVRKHYQRLGVHRLAVRSSATAEDLPQYSFAGQHGTYFVSGLDDCLRKIKHCWASLWTERVFEYRKRNKFDHLGIDMAVVVQELIAADVSGVLFTADPVTSQSNRLIIESCYGLGEALVSGKVTPDRMVLAKDDLRILKQEVAEKTVEVVFDKRNGVQEQDVASERSKLPCLGEAVARRLGELAKKAEPAFGEPQDMEWAVRDTEIFFLQSRPITTITQKKSWEDRQIWTNINTAEILPDVVTPVYWSALQVVLKALFGSIFGWIGINFGDNPIIGLVAGRVYFNLNTMAGVLRYTPGLRKMDVTQVLGGEQGRMEELGQLEINSEDIPDLGFNPLKAIFKLPVFVFQVLKHSPKNGLKFVAQVERENKPLLHLGLASMSEEEISSCIRSTIDSIHNRAHGLVFAMVAMSYFTRLDKVCRKWFGDKEGKTYANRLLAGVGNMDSAEAGLALWTLAVKAHKNQEVEGAILSSEGWEMAKQRISKARGGNEFLSNWDSFMAQHGHHSRGELDVFIPRWSETADYILGIVCGYLQSMGSVDPLENYRKRACKRDELANRCRECLKNPIKRLVFDFLFKQAQWGSLVRENIKNTAVKYWMAPLRFLFLELGERLTSRGVLDDKEDIFFLYIEEIDFVRTGKANFDVKAVVAARRDEYKKNLTVTPPKVVMGRFDPRSFIPEKVEEGVEIFRGIAVSPGVVTGPARVILRADTDEQVMPGEILVAPFTDPGWTPYFLPAAAIVMDQGGLLSHGSIIAREYGIPAVVNVGPATRVIKTGQTIRVDGNQGVVRILRKT